MARSPFSLYRRRRSGATVFAYYVQFWDPQVAAYSTGHSIERLRDALHLDPHNYSHSRKSDAKLVALLWLKERGGIKNSHL